MQGSESVYGVCRKAWPTARIKYARCVCPVVPVLVCTCWSTHQELKLSYSQEGPFLEGRLSLEYYGKCYTEYAKYEDIYLLLTEFEGRTVSYGPSFFLLDLWPKREARGP